MNIDDVDAKDIQIPKLLAMKVKAIFEKQQALMDKYDQIEQRNGAIVAHGSIDEKLVQYRLKDLFWRTTEEIAEALENPVNLDNSASWKNRWDSEVDVRHFFEELADAVHFLVEASITADHDYIRVANLWDTVFNREVKTVGSVILPTRQKELLGEIIWSMGLAANCLKNKPWKNTHMPTDKTKFLLRLDEAWVAFMNAFMELGCDPDDVFLLYMRKSEVNKFRQRTNY